MFALAQIQKTGSVSLSELLRRSFGTAHCDVEPWAGYAALPFDAADFRWVRRLHRPLESIAGHTVMPYSDLESVCPDLRYYTIVREPVRRTASHYQFHRQEMGIDRPFPAWIGARDKWNVQCTHIAGVGDADAAIELIQEKDMFVGLLESFDESVQLLQGWMGRALAVQERPRNVARGQSIARSLLADPASRELLEQANVEDARLYRWVSEVWMPRQRERWAQLPADAAPARHGSMHLGFARLHRNLVYKPVLRIAQRIAAR